MIIKLTSLVLLAFMLLSPDESKAADLNPSCPDSKFFEHIITDTCWDCFFPIRIAGSDWGSQQLNYNKPAGVGGVTATGSLGAQRPAGAATDAFCACFDNLGVPEFGFSLGAWFPTQLVEMVRMPYCSPTLSGNFISSNLRLLGGSKMTEFDGTDKGFYQYHYFAYPMMFMLDMLSEPECNPGGYFDFDLMYLSELDPSWNEDELAVFATPEVLIFANPLAIAACASDSAAASAGSPIDSLFWCAGSWGHMYPLSGNITSYGSPPRDTALLTTRVLATMHRRGMAYGTVGNNNLCEASFAPMIPKSQYKLSQMYPMPEANANHWIGQTPYMWGEWRNIPAVGEDFVNVVWRWTDCCLR